MIAVIMSDGSLLELAGRGGGGGGGGGSSMMSRALSESSTPD